MGGPEATTGSGIDFEDSSGNIDARFFGDNNGIQISADPSNATGSSIIRFEVDGTEKAKLISGGFFKVRGSATSYDGGTSN